MRAENIITNRPGITSYAATQIDVDNVRTAFDVCFTLQMTKTVIKHTNQEGRRVYKEDWSDIDEPLIALKRLLGCICWPVYFVLMERLCECYGTKNMVDTFFEPQCHWINFKK